MTQNTFTFEVPHNPYMQPQTEFKEEALQQDPNPLIIVGAIEKEEIRKSFSDASISEKAQTKKINFLEKTIEELHSLFQQARDDSAEKQDIIQVLNNLQKKSPSEDDLIFKNPKNFKLYKRIKKKISQKDLQRTLAHMISSPYRIWWEDYNPLPQKDPKLALGNPVLPQPAD